jgi:tetratricopeptide (TPR) repeat protein
MKQIKAILLIIVINILSLSFFTSPVVAEICKEWVAKIVSIQGSVHARKAGAATWQPVKLYDTFCPGDMIRVLEQSRAAIALINGPTLRLDQNTTVTFNGLEKEQTSLIDLIKGAIYFLSRYPRSLKVSTPFVNGTVEGTEFYVRVDTDKTFLSIFEGKVAARNKSGSIMLVSGQSAVAEAERAPALQIVVRPRDAVQWTLYYPPIIHYRPEDFQGFPETDWRTKVRKSIELYMKGDFQGAFDSIKGVSEDIREPRFFTYQASLLLSVGRVEEAKADIEKALNLAPNNSHAIALQAIIAIAQNEKEKALTLAKKAVDIDPNSVSARIALSYAQQAHFDLKGSLNSLKDAVKLAPENALAWARLAELWMSFGELNEALNAANKAASLNPDLSRTQTVLGYAYLTRVKIKESKEAFEKAIELDQADPLPRLGLGLAKIRDGDLKKGCRDIEIAATLDTGNSLIRSYLGKAYYEEKRDKLSEEQLTKAEELDPADPTPFFYDAIRKQSINRPVEALYDMQEAIELNDNRAIYRSKLLLDSDLAARSASLGRIYTDLGFQQLALVEGWKSVNSDPADFSGHRFLADSYSALPRHEIARVSELLQSQLLQPINITPLQPHLAESNLFILDGAGPADMSFNEFNPLFNRNRLALQLSGIAGGENTFGDEAVASGLYKGASISAGQFHYENNGFRENNDQRQDIYNVFTQVALSLKTSIQAEFRSKDFERGDLSLFFDPNFFYQDLRQKDEIKSARFGLHHAFAPNSDLIGSVIYLNGDFSWKYGPAYIGEMEEDGYMTEVQHLFRSEGLSIISGAGYFRATRETRETFLGESLPPAKTGPWHTNLYVYSNSNLLRNITLTIGGSANFLKGDISGETIRRDQFNPKIGVTWNPFPNTRVRGAIFRVVNRAFLTDQTIEPTQVAGFNQFFNDTEGTKSWRYGIGIDQKFSTQIYGGAEFSKRDLEVPGFSFLEMKLKEGDWEEQLGRAYLYYTPHKWLALSAEYQYERFKRPEEFAVENITRLNTHRFLLGLGFFHPSGIIFKLKTTYIDQNGNFLTGFAPPDFMRPIFEHKKDNFWVVNASIGYRLPKRFGIITVEAINLFDKEFNFQDTDPGNPRIQPKRLILARFTLAL